jgi:hypothetical protein
MPSSQFVGIRSTPTLFRLFLSDPIEFYFFYSRPIEI